MGKTNFLIEKSWGAMFRRLPDEKAGQLIKMLFDYEEGITPDCEDDVLISVFEMLKEKIDRNEDAYAEVCRKRKEAVMKRWNKSKQEDTGENKSIEENTKVYKSIQKNTESPSNHNHIYINNNIKSKSKSKSKYSEEIKEIVEYLNSVCGTKYRSDSATTVRHISARLEEKYTVDDFKKVIDTKFAQWGRDQKMKEYLRPQTLFAGNFESYLNQTPAPEQKQQGKNQFNRFQAQTYDFDAIKKQIVSNQ